MDILFEDLHDVYTKYYSWLPEEEFLAICKIDPTSKDDKMGSYSKWLLSMRRSNRKPFSEDDAKELHDQLAIFDKSKMKYDQEDRNIFGIADLEDLIEINHKYEVTAEKSTQEIENSKRKDIEIIASTPSWEVYSPLTWDASKHLRGDDAVWCTGRHNSDHYWKSYKNNGNKLYIFINKNNRHKKYQCAVRAKKPEEFRDARNGPVEFVSFLCINNELIEPLRDHIDSKLLQTVEDLKIYAEGKLYIIDEKSDLAFNALGKYIWPVVKNLKIIRENWDSNIFEDSENLTSVIFENTESIEHGSFRNCKNLTSVILPETFKDLGYGVFAGCDNVQISIPKGVKFRIRSIDSDFLHKHVVRR